MALYKHNTTVGNLFVGTATVNNAYSVAGSNGYTNTAWATAVAPMTVGQQGTIELNGDKADIIMNGTSIKNTLAAIESRLALLTPNAKLEKEWEELKRIGDEYRQLEAEITEKMKTWNTLSDTTL